MSGKTEETRTLKSGNDTDYTLQFLSNDADEEEGMGHAGIETYRGSPYAGAARECGQNSADASRGKPVKLTFDHIEITASELPALDDYKSTVSMCLTRAQEAEDKKAIAFFERAAEVLNSDSIQVLRIADFNTKGLTGPSKKGTPFHSLLKGSGVSKKESETSGGSFGIGKNAAFAISEFQTVFYSTIYRDPETQDECFLSQGKSIFISHLDKNEDPKRSVGYWGAKDFQPVCDENTVPKWLKREKTGTSIYALGFKVSPGWQYHMAASLLTNFFCAILGNEMEFSLNHNEIIINDKTIAGMFENPQVKEAAKENNDLESFDFAKSLFECLVSDEAVEKQLDIEGLGKVSVRILVRESLQKRIGIIRNGMMITDNLSKFGDSFRRFPMYSDFVALIDPVDEEGNTLIRSLENPSHDELSAERVTDEDQQRKAKKTISKLAKEIRETIKQETLVEPEDQVALDELNEFFADADDNDSLPDPNSETNPETFKYTPPAKPKQKPVQTQPVEVDGEEGGAGGNGGAGSGSSKGDQGSGEGSGHNGIGNRSYNLPIELKGFRNILDGNSRKLFFTPTETCKATIQVQASGLADSENLFVEETSEAKAENGKVFINLEADVRTTINVWFKEEYSGPIEVVAVKNVEGGQI